MYLPRTVHHTQCSQITIRYREEDSDHDGGEVVGEDDRQVLARLDVTQHVERDEHHSHNTQEKQHSTGFPWLQKKEIKSAVLYL